MNTFTLDTSGRVLRGVIRETGFHRRPGFVHWSDLSPFAQGYVEAAKRAVPVVRGWNSDMRAEADGVCIGEHIGDSIVEELATALATAIREREEAVQGALNKAWRAVDALGRAFDPDDRHALGYDAALRDATTEIEKLGGKWS